MPRFPALTELPDPSALTKTALEWLEALIKAAIAQHGRAVIGLSGGTTPGPIYTALGRAEGIDWAKVWIFLVDDRVILPDAPKSNQFLLRSTLLKHAPIPESQILFPDTTLSIEDCVRQYDEVVGALVAKHGIDAVTLGLGNDGHTASLFPPLTENAFGPTSVIHATTKHFDVFDRVSVTLPILQAARSILVILKGEEKRKVWLEMVDGKEGPNRWPIKALIDRAPMTVLIAK